MDEAVTSVQQLQLEIATQYHDLPKVPAEVGANMALASARTPVEGGVARVKGAEGLPPCWWSCLSLSHIWLLLLVAPGNRPCQYSTGVR